MKVPEVSKPIEITLRLLPDGKLEVSAPKDAGLVLFMVSSFLKAFSQHVSYKEEEKHIVIPKIPLPSGALKTILGGKNG